MVIMGLLVQNQWEGSNEGMKIPPGGRDKNTLFLVLLGWGRWCILVMEVRGIDFTEIEPCFYYSVMKTNI